MRPVFSEHAWRNYLHWQTTDRKTLKRVNTRIGDILRSPHDGIGKPEPLRHGLTGYWSHRVDREHRLVYKMERDTVPIAQCRHHH